MLETLSDMPETVLDVGASDGYLELFFENHGIRYTGVDPTPRRDGIIKGTLESIVMPQKFDLILLIHVLEHVINPYGLMAKAYQKLNTDGIIFIATPHADSPWAWEYDDHHHLFNESIMERMLSKTGFFMLEDLTITFRGDKKELWETAQKRSLS